MATQQQLDEAENALHALLTGKALASVTMPGGRVLQYTPAEADKLETYVARLRRELGGASKRRRVRYVVPT